MSKHFTYSLALPLLLFHSSCGETEKNSISQLGKVEISNQPIEQFADLKMNFSCKDRFKKNQEDLVSWSISELDISEDEFKVLNEASQIFEGHRIEIFIDKSMNIEDIQYYAWYDAINSRAKNRYEVIKAKVNLSLNPFLGAKQELNGNYHLIIEQTTDYGFLWKKDRTYTFSFKGRFKCAKSMW